MEQLRCEEEEQNSTIIEGVEAFPSNYGGEESSTSSNPIGIFPGDGMVVLEEGSFDHTIIKKSFLMGIGSAAKNTEIVAIHKNMSTSIRGKSRLESFQIFSQAVAAKCGGNANIKHAWYGASKNEISEIVSYGYSRIQRPANGRCYGIGIHLSPAKFSFDGALAAEEDEYGLRHVLSCRVILGKVEVVKEDSGQFHPSSQEYDSGVDNLLEPRRYIVWSAFMNSHIFPSYVVSFRAPCLRTSGQAQAKPLRPTSPWMRFSALMSILERYLPPSKMNLIAKCHSDFHNKKISRQQLIRRVRQLAGDRLLILAIKDL